MLPDSLARNLRALLKADTAIADIRLQHLLISFGLKALAALIAVFGLLMVELAAYFALVQVWTVIHSALALAVINFVIAGAIMIIAAKRPQSRELELAREVHDAAIRNLQADFMPHPAQAVALLRHPIGRLLPSLILPMITLGLGALQKSRSSAPKTKV